MAEAPGESPRVFPRFRVKRMARGKMGNLWRPLAFKVDSFVATVFASIRVFHIQGKEDLRCS